MMRAAWYDQQGPASEVLRVGQLEAPEPGPGEVRVRLRLSGINPGDTKERSGWPGSSMPHQRVIPHSDGAGVVDSVGDGVAPGRVGSRVWVWGAQSYRALGTAAEFTVVPADHVVDLPDEVSDELGASLGITAHRTVFGDGPVAGQTVLVHGVLGGVGSLAAQLARWGGATVIGTVRRTADLDRVDPAVAAHTVALEGAGAAERIRAIAPEGVDRVIEVSLSDNADLDVKVLAIGGIIAAYASRLDRPELPFWPLLFSNITLRLLGSDDFPAAAAKLQAAEDLTAAARAGALGVTVAEKLPLQRVAEAHDLVDAGSGGRVLLTIP